MAGDDLFALICIVLLDFCRVDESCPRKLMFQLMFSGPAAQETKIALCYTEQDLYVFEHAFDNHVFSNASECHDSVWTNDAV